MENELWDSAAEAAKLVCPTSYHRKIKGALARAFCAGHKVGWASGYTNGAWELSSLQGDLDASRKTIEQYQILAHNLKYDNTQEWSKLQKEVDDLKHERDCLQSRLSKPEPPATPEARLNQALFTLLNLGFTVPKIVTTNPNCVTPLFPPSCFIPTEGCREWDRAFNGNSLRIELCNPPKPVPCPTCGRLDE